MLRKTLFWMHLTSGLLAGIVILMMSVTGALLTYERQLLDWADRRAVGAISVGEQRMSISNLLERLVAAEPDFEPQSILVPRDASAPVRMHGTRGSGSRYMDPYTGEVLGAGASEMQDALATIRAWHRWFNAAPEHRDPWRAVTGISNLLFLFLLLSGSFLWLPPMYRWSAFRVRMLFASMQRDSRARDYNLHHVIAFWTVLPLIVIVFSATIISYSWAGDLVYRAFGESPPERVSPGVAAALATTETRRASLDELLAVAMTHVDDWQRIRLSLPEFGERAMVFNIERGTSMQPQYRNELTLDVATGAVIEWMPFSNQAPGRKTRLWLRFLHTGEALGLAGQTVAGFVSLTIVLMVWTGFALAWRRLLSPVLSRRRSPAHAAGANDASTRKHLKRRRRSL